MHAAVRLQAKLPAACALAMRVGKAGLGAATLAAYLLLTAVAPEPQARYAGRAGPHPPPPQQRRAELSRKRSLPLTLRSPAGREAGGRILQEGGGTDREILLAFAAAQKNSTRAPGGCLESWNQTDDPCDGSWRGVRLSFSLAPSNTASTASSQNAPLPPPAFLWSFPQEYPLSNCVSCLCP
eukprot:SAG22_NODE_1231_length_5073_cov_16.438480_3_plen_182_part_00